MNPVARASSRFGGYGLKRMRAMPAQLRAGLVLGDQAMGEYLGIDTCPLGQPGAQRMQEWRHGCGGMQCLVREIVAAAETHRAAFRGPLAILCFGQRQPADLRKQIQLLR